MANLYYAEGVSSDAFAVGATVAVTGEEARHAVRVARLRVAERIAVGDAAGTVGHGEVVAVDRDRFAVRLDQIEVTAQSRPRLVLVQALAKGDRDERAVELATEFGVDQVIAWQASRSVSRWSGSGAAEKSAKGLAKWAKIAREAAKQSMRARVPEVRQFVSTDELCDLVGAPGVIAAVLHPRADRTLTEWAEMCSHPEVEQVLMIVGPEGGLSDSEVAGLQRAGATSTVLGSHVLRTSSAGAAALAVLNVSLRRW